MWPVSSSSLQPNLKRSVTAVLQLCCLLLPRLYDVPAGAQQLNSIVLAYQLWMPSSYRTNAFRGEITLISTSLSLFPYIYGSGGPQI